MIKKRWKDRDHVFNAPNITRLEVCVTFDIKETVPKNITVKFKPRRQRHSKVRIIPVEEYLAQLNKGDKGDV